MSDNEDELLRKSEELQEQHRKAMVESHKMEFDIHKTQATLVTGSLVAVIALSNLLIPDEPKYLWMLGVSCILLLFSMGWSLASMIRLMTTVMLAMSPFDQRSEEKIEADKRSASRSRSFPLGIGVFAAYVWFNAI